MILSNNNGTFTPVAGGTGTFIGTKAAFDAVKATLPENTVAYITDDGVRGDVTEITPTFTAISDPTVNNFYSKAWVDNRTGMVTVYLVVNITNINEWNGGHNSLGKIHGIPCVKGTGNGYAYIPIPMYKSGVGRAVNGFFNGCYGHNDIGDIGFKFLSSEVFAPNTQNHFNCYFTYMGDLDHYIA